MRRDWTKIREVLKDIEADCLDEKLSSLEEKARRLRSLGEESSEEDVYYGHLLLAIEAGLVAGVEIDLGVAPPPPWQYGSTVPRLTMSGHDVLDSMRSSAVWSKLKTIAVEQSLPITIELIKAVAASLVKI